MNELQKETEMETLINSPAQESKLQRFQEPQGILPGPGEKP